VTPLQLLGLGGTINSLGIVLAAAALRPAPPQLQAALTLLTATPSPARSVTASPAGRWSWLPGPVAAQLDRQLGVADADLRLIGWTRPQLAARKLAAAGVGLLLLPPLLTTALALIGVALPIAIPAVAGIGIAALLWTVPSTEARDRAARARAEFRAALACFLDLVALERLARGSVPEALETAAAVADSAPFTRIRAALARAAHAGQPPWSALRELGEDVDVPELRNLADIAAVAADGAAVYQTLLAESRSLRHAQAAAAHAEANVTSEKLVYPLALLGIGFMLLVFIPAVIRLFGA
jgi:tight adherence protein C